MTIRQNISGQSPYEPIIGFSRAVRAGQHVFVSGTGPAGTDTASPAEQTRAVLAIIEKCLRDAGSCLEDVVRTRIYLTRAEDWREVGRVHGQVFETVRPAATMVVVAALLHPNWRVEIEADALIPHPAHAES